MLSFVCFPFESLDEVQLQCMRTSELYRIHGAGVAYIENNLRSHDDCIGCG